MPNLCSSNSPTSSSLASNPSGIQKKVIVKTRILAPSENLFVLTHVWNQMKQDRKDGFKYSKIILTKKNSTKLSTSPKKQSTLLKHRFSLQPKTSSSIAISSNMNKFDHTTGKQSHKSFAVHQKRARSSLNRLVRQKSFDESFEQMDEKINDQFSSLAINEDEADVDSSRSSNLTDTNNEKMPNTSNESEMYNLVSNKIGNNEPIDLITTVTTTVTKNHIEPNDGNLFVHNLDDISSSKIPNKIVTEIIESSSEILVHKENSSLTTNSLIEHNPCTNNLKLSSPELKDLKGSPSKSTTPTKTSPQRQSTIKRFLKLRL